MVDSNYKTLNSLMRHIRTSAGMKIGGGRDKKTLAQIGYFHGYKGYRYSGSPTKRIPFDDFRQLQAVMEFDSKLKALFYPVLMKIEMHMKNYALVEIQNAAESSALADIYSNLMPGNKREGKQGKLKVIHASSETLLKAYLSRNPIICHYYDMPAEAVPVWALWEVITLGHFARFIEQLSDQTLNSIASRSGMRRSDGQLVPHFVYAIVGLRNAVAHNGVVFDTRFATEKVRKDIQTLLASRLGFPKGVQLEFQTITDYFVLVAYLAYCLGFSKTDVRRIIREYVALSEELRQRVPKRVFDMIVHTDNRPKLLQLEQWVRAQ